ncbi:MAG: Bacillolysin [Euryarchaeota archaeon]|nr:Bacillolysin [Euryarchaeota archaeon]
MNKIDEIIKILRNKDPKVSFMVHPEQAAITLLQGKLAAPVKVEALKKDPFGFARKFFQEKKGILGAVDEKDDLVNEQVTTDRHGRTHVTFTQKYGDATVLGAKASVHYAADGSAYLMMSNLAYGIDLPKKPKITTADAMKGVQEIAGKDAKVFNDMKAELFVVDAKIVHNEAEGQKYYLCWNIPVLPSAGSRIPPSHFFVDATSGKVLLHYPAIKRGTGTGYYSHGASVISEVSGATHRLRDTVTSSAWAVDPGDSKPVLETYDDANANSYTKHDFSEDSNDTWDNGGTPPAHRYDDQRAEVDIHRYLGYVLNYYWLTHGRNSLNGHGMTVKAHAHNMYDPANTGMPDNAFWWGWPQEIYVGDGAGALPGFDYMCPLEVMAHEYTHGINDKCGILQTYDGEIGALDEALADIGGALIASDYPVEDAAPWNVGEQCDLHVPKVGRNMADPHHDGYPDHYSIRYTGAADYHGVHINCTIITHAVYLMINGGTNRVSGITVAGIGITPVEQMIYEIVAQPGYLTATSVFSDFRTKFIVACQTLFPDNLDYLATVKGAFTAVGIGSDLYIRDTLTDQGVEPATTLSCMSPDIIVRQLKADASTLTQIQDLNNGSLGENIQFGPNDHYVYFRLKNRGSAAASGTFRLFISPVSTFPTPASWTQVGTYNFPSIAAGGSWVPATNNDCITMPGTMITALGTGHFCFIGIIENIDDPAPDRMQINTEAEFHDFIRKSNNFAWRNCDIATVTPNRLGTYDPVEGKFEIRGFDPRKQFRELEVDRRDLPAGTQVTVWIPAIKVLGLKASEIRAQNGLYPVNKIGDALMELPIAKAPILRPATPALAVAATSAPVMVAPELALEAPAIQATVRRLPIYELVQETPEFMIPNEIKKPQLTKWRALTIAEGKIIRLHNLAMKKEEKIDVHFVVKFPPNLGWRDVTLVFREREDSGALGQMNFVFRIRPRG